jgi:hypothetical protein
MVMLVYRINIPIFNGKTIETTTKSDNHLAVSQNSLVSGPDINLQP